MKRTVQIAASLSVVALALTGCGNRPSEGGGSGSDKPLTAPEVPMPKPAKKAPANFKACMVSDSGGFDDKSFNQTSHDGLTYAKKTFGIETGEVESNSDSEYADNIGQLVKAGCTEITTVGFLLGDATEAAAKKNPNVDFSIVDFAYEKPQKNIKGLVFDTASPSYLAGYLAAAKSESGTVGTFGGQNIPTVTSFMDGFVQGVERFNKDNDKDVKVLGWDMAKKNGSFTDDFEDKSKGQTIGEQMIQQGADVIMPVAGPAGLGGLQAAKDNDVKAIWVDTDGCKSASEYCDVLLTSVTKSMDRAVAQAIADSIDGTFDNKLYQGTLKNGGVGLAPFHKAEGDIDSDLQKKIVELEKEIADGKTTVKTSS